MKFVERIKDVEDWVIVVLLLFVFLPICILFLLYKLIMTPIDYLRYKRSLYQKDFPHKYTWLAEPHMDNKPYTAIKENNLPVEYIKSSEDYNLPGYFIYRDLLLVFSNPLFFDKKRGEWLFWPHAADAEEMSGYDEDEDEAKNEEIDYDDTSDCVQVKEACEFILEDFKEHLPERICNKVVFFYSKEKIKKTYGKAALEAAYAIPEFVVYEKKKLGESILGVINGYGSDT